MMASHCRSTYVGCFAALRQTHSIVILLVLIPLDYSIETLAVIPAYLIRPLQSVMNAASRLISGLTCTAHISTSLNAAEQIQLKLVMLTIAASTAQLPAICLLQFIVLLAFLSVHSHVLLLLF